MSFVTEGFKLIAGDSSAIRLGTSGRDRWQGLRAVIQEESRRLGVPWPLVAGIAWTESSFVPTAKGPPVPWHGRTEHAHGLMQIMSFHFGDLVGAGIWSAPDNWQDPRASIRAAVWLLRSKGLGSDPIHTVLARYGGFVTQDPDPYINKILSRATFLFLDDLSRQFTGAP